MIFLLWQPFLINWWAKCLFWYKHLWTAIQKYHADQSHSDQVGFDWSMRRCNWLVGMKSCMWLVGMIFLVAIYKCLSFHSLDFSLGLSHWKRFWLVCTMRRAIQMYRYNTTHSHIHSNIHSHIHSNIHSNIHRGVKTIFFKPNFGRWNWF